MRTCVIVTALFVGSLALAQADAPAAKEIPTKDLKLTFPKKSGKPTEPTVIKTADDLAKNEVVGMAADELKKKVDFTKEKLLVFAWSGSGQDIVSVGISTAGDKKFISVAYRPGKTRDLRQHMKLYAVPKDLSIGK